MMTLNNFFEAFKSFLLNLSNFDKSGFSKSRKIPFSKISQKLKCAIEENIDEIGKKVVIPNRFEIFFSQFDRNMRRDIEDILKSELEEELYNLSKEWNNRNIEHFYVEIQSDDDLKPGEFYIECSLDRSILKTGENKFSERVNSLQQTLIEDKFDLENDNNPLLNAERKFLPLISDDAIKIIQENKTSFDKDKNRIYILKISYNDEEKYIDLEDGVYTVGRSERCDISLKSTDHKISRRHIELIMENDKIFVMPLGINGTYLNEEKLELGKKREIFIKDQIKMGDYTFELKLLVFK